MKILKNYFAALVFISLFTIINKISFAQITHSIDLSNYEVTIENIKESNGKYYSKVYLGELLSNQLISNPELPVKYVKLIIPNNQKPVSFDVNLGSEQKFVLDYPVYPIQEFDNPWDDKVELEFKDINTDVYSSNSCPEKMVRMVNDGFIDGANHIVTLEVQPFKYLHEEGVLYYYRDLVITLKSETYSYNLVEPQIRNSEYKRKVINSLYSLVDNPEDVEKYITSSNILEENSTKQSTIYFEYIIVTTGILKPYFEKFAEWKRKKGFDVGIVTTSTIYQNFSGDLTSGIYDDAGKIREFLKEGYTNHGTIYALLAGDSYTVPIRYGCALNGPPVPGDEIPADLYFADFNGDWETDADGEYGEKDDDNIDYYNEIYVSRLLCNDNDASNIDNWVKKVLLYEQNPGNGDYNYLTNNFFIQADAAQIGNYAESFMNNFPLNFNNTKIEELPSATDPSPYYPKGEDVTSILNNSNFGLLSFSMHGSPKELLVTTHGNNGGRVSSYFSLYEYSSSWPVTPGGLDEMSNFDFPNILHSIGCDLMPFDDLLGFQNNYNFGESFTVLGEYGGVSMIGNTRLGSDQGKYVFKNFLTSLFPAVTKSSRATSSLGLANSSEIGYHFWNAKSNYVGQGDYHYQLLTINLLGCPQTEYWRSTPQEFSNIVITENGSSITVNTNNLSNCTISVKSLDPSNSFQESVYDETNYTFVTSVRPLSITVSKHYATTTTFEVYIPYQAITGGTYSRDIVVDYWNEIHIPAGSVIELEDDVKIDVRGNLIVDGTSSNPVLFTSSDPTPVLNDWQGIEVNGSNASATLSYCTVEYASKGINFSNGASGTVSNSTLQNNYFGIYTNFADPIVDNCNITNNQFGIYSRYSYTSPSWTSVDISACDILNNTTYGLYLYNSSPTLSDNRISGNARGAVLYYSSNSIIEQSTFTNSSYYGLACYGSASPKLHYNSVYSFGGYNTITSNGSKGIRVTGSSNPNFGNFQFSLAGFNSI